MVYCGVRVCACSVSVFVCRVSTGLHADCEKFDRLTEEQRTTRETCSEVRGTSAREVRPLYLPVQSCAAGEGRRREITQIAR